MTRVRILMTILTIGFVALVGIIISFFARGYKFDTKTFKLGPQGLFVATSVPDGAEILVNGNLESATNATISLAPGTYNVEIKKEGYISWKKEITIKKEEVTKVDVYLFPQAPSLSPLTFTGVINPILSPDRTKLVYGVPKQTENSIEDKDRIGIWVMELADLPIGFSRDPKKITDLDPEKVSWKWTPDSRQILISSESSKYLIEAGSLTTKDKLTPLTKKEVDDLLSKWKKDKEKKEEQNLAKLPKEISEILKNKTSNFVFSPDEKRVLYTATEDAQIPDNLISELPGSSTQHQERSIMPGNTYIYDIKEDRNFLIYQGPVDLNNKSALDQLSSEAKQEVTLQGKNQNQNKIVTEMVIQNGIYWFPSSNHVIIAESGNISIEEYDGTNKQTIYGGAYQNPIAFPFPNTSRILMLTNFGASQKVSNLYAIILK